MNINFKVNFFLNETKKQLVYIKQIANMYKYLSDTKLLQEEFKLITKATGYCSIYNFNSVYTRLNISTIDIND